MRVTTTYKTNKTGAGRIVARSSTGKQYTMPYDHAAGVAANHGKAANRLVSRTAPGYRRNEVLNSVKCVEALNGKSVFVYKDV